MQSSPWGNLRVWKTCLFHKIIYLWVWLQLGGGGGRNLYLDWKWQWDISNAKVQVQFKLQHENFHLMSCKPIWSGATHVLSESVITFMRYRVFRVIWLSYDKSSVKFILCSRHLFVLVFVIQMTPPSNLYHLSVYLIVPYLLWCRLVSGDIMHSNWRLRRHGVKRSRHHLQKFNLK